MAIHDEARDKKIWGLAMPESPGIVHPMKSALRSKVGATAALALALAAALPGRSQDAQSTEPAPREQIPQAQVPDGDGFKNDPGYLSEEVTFKAGAVTSKAYLALPKNKTQGPFAGVLISPEWWGHNDYVRMRADMLAKLGYAALAMDLYGDGQKAHDPQTAIKLDGSLKGNQKEMAARVLAHLKFLAARPEVDENKIAAIGYGSGGDVCLQMARNGMRGLDGVVAFHPFFTVVPSQPPIRKATARVMVCDAREDPYVHLRKGKVEAFRKEMARVKTDLTMIDFPNAMQSFTVPGANRVGEKFRIPQAYNQEADTRAWGLLRGFLQDLWAPAGEAAESPPAATRQ